MEGRTSVRDRLVIQGQSLLPSFMCLRQKVVEDNDQESTRRVFDPLDGSDRYSRETPFTLYHLTMSSSSTPESIKITYTINPPSSITPTPDLTKTKSVEYLISPTGIPPAEDKAGKAYYGELRKALEAARTGLGEDLTRWRDMVGKTELTKEPKKVEDNDDEEQEEEEQV
jgi:hypothetical protein